MEGNEKLIRGARRGRAPVAARKTENIKKHGSKQKWMEQNTVAEQDRGCKESEG